MDKTDLSDNSVLVFRRPFGSLRDASDHFLARPLRIKTLDWVDFSGFACSSAAQEIVVETQEIWTSRLSFDTLNLLSYNGFGAGALQALPSQHESSLHKSFDMAFDYEKYVPREKAIIFDDRLEASSGTVFQIVHEFFEPHFLMHQIKFGDHLCWTGFRTAPTGDDNRGWIRIESVLGVIESDAQLCRPLDVPAIEVGTVSVRSLSPVASRVLIRINYTPEALSYLFNGLAKYLVWVVNGEDAREAWSRAVTREYVKTVPQIDAAAVSLLQAPSEMKEQTQKVEHTLIGQTIIQKPQGKGESRKTRKRPRRTKAPRGRPATKKIFVPANPHFFERYRKMWRVIRKTQYEYAHPANDQEETRPNPTYDELRAAISDSLGFKPSEKTVRRVIQAGTAGLLKKKK